MNAPNVLKQRGLGDLSSPAWSHSTHEKQFRRIGTLQPARGISVGKSILDAKRLYLRLFENSFVPNNFLMLDRL